jgi:hypothetical protein
VVLWHWFPVSCHLAVIIPYADTLLQRYANNSLPKVVKDTIHRAVKKCQTSRAYELIHHLITKDHAIIKKNRSVDEDNLPILFQRLLVATRADIF